jgi:hypothetical protein
MNLDSMLQIIYRPGTHTCRESDLVLFSLQICGDVVETIVEMLNSQNAGGSRKLQFLAPHFLPKDLA